MWWYSYEGIQGCFEFFKVKPEGTVDGILHGPFDRFSHAKQDLMKTIKSDMFEVKMTLEQARRAKAKDAL